MQTDDIELKMKNKIKNAKRQNSMTGWKEKLIYVMAVMVVFSSFLMSSPLSRILLLFSTAAGLRLIK